MLGIREGNPGLVIVYVPLWKIPQPGMFVLAHDLPSGFHILTGGQARAYHRRTDRDAR